MYSFDFKTRLRKLNKHLFVDDSRRAQVSEGFYGASLYLKKYGHSTKDTSQLNRGQRGYLESLEMNDFVCAVPLEWVPEYDEFNLETGKVVARGWRSILLVLVKRKIVTIERARIVFNCQGLGQEEYDNVDIKTRLKWARGYRFKPEPKDWRDVLKSYTNF